MNRSVFRQTALEQLSTPEQLDQLIQITTPQGWLALLALGLLILAAIAWGFWGRIPDVVVGRGFLIRPGGVNQVISTVEGQMTQVHVEVGELIQEGQVIARVAQEGQIAAQRIVSPYAGRVLEIKAGVGDLIKRGTPILSLELVGQDTQDLVAIIYVPPAEGIRIQPGMKAQITPETIATTQDAFIEGTVVARGEFPVTYQGMLQSLGSQSLVQAILAETNNRPPIKVIVNLTPGQNGPRWSGGKKAPVRVDHGMYCTARIILERKRPIDILFQRR